MRSRCCSRRRGGWRSWGIWPGWPRRSTAAPPGPTATPDDGRKFVQRSLRLDEYYKGNGQLAGNLSQRCTAALRAVLESLAGKTGPEDTRTLDQRRHDALEEALERLLAARVLPAEPGQPSVIQLEHGPGRAAGPGRRGAGGGGLGRVRCDRAAGRGLRRDHRAGGDRTPRPRPAGPARRGPARPRHARGTRRWRHGLRGVHRRRDEHGRDRARFGRLAWSRPGLRPAVRPRAERPDVLHPRPGARHRRAGAHPDPGDPGCGWPPRPRRLAAAEPDVRACRAGQPAAGHRHPHRDHPPHLRRAVVLRDKHCAFPRACSKPPAACHVHHVQPREPGAGSPALPTASCCARSTT